MTSGSGNGWPDVIKVPVQKVDHDPMCRQQHWEGGDCFDCRLIAKVRADERDNVGEMGIRAARKGAAIAVTEWKAEFRARVESLPARGVVYPYDLDSLVPEALLYRADVLALLEPPPA